MSELRQKIAHALIKTRLGLTTRELAEDFKIKVQQINGTIQQMANSGLVERGDVLAGEGQVWLITENGILEYGSKNVVESPLEQNENLRENPNCRHAIEDFEIANLKPSNSVELEPVVKESLTTEIEDFETRAPFSNDEIESFEIPKQAKVNTDNFKIWELIDEMGAKFANLLAESKSKPIENIDYKIATLESLADIYNPKISATLREIVADLRS